MRFLPTATVLAMAFNVPAALAGDGSFPSEPAGSPFATGAYPQSLAVDDFNSDGNADLAVADSGASTISVLLGAGNGDFPNRPAGSPYGTGDSPYAITAADLNRDGHADLVTANKDADNLTIRLGAGDGTFPDATKSTLTGVGPVDAPVNVAAGDFNADYILDLAVANRDSSNVSIFYGFGNGTYAEAPGSPYGTGAKPYMVAVADFNADGRDDIAVAGSDSDNVSVHLASTFAPGYFDAPATFAAGSNPRALAVGDYDGNGTADLAIANAEAVVIRLGTGDGSFATEAPGSPVDAGSTPGSIAAGDFNSDDHEDLAVTNESANGVTVRLGAGDGSFPSQSAGSPFGTGPNPYFGAVGDFNADGVQDLAVADNGAAGVTIRLGSGAPLLAGNLLVNGGAEGAGADAAGGGSTPPPGWETPGLMRFVRYSSTGDVARLSDAARWEGGLSFFAPVDDDPDTLVEFASQTVDVSQATASIDAGLATARLQADLGGRRATENSMRVSSTFRDGAAQPLGTIEIGPVSAADRKNLTTLLRRAQSLPVPAGTRSIEVRLTSIRVPHTLSQTYADNIKLTVDAPAPPAPPIGADTTPPDLALSGKRVQRLGAFVSVRARCASEACRVGAAGFLAARKHHKPALRRRKLSKSGAQLSAGNPRTLRIRIPRKARRAAKAALATGAKVTATLTVTATDAAGNSRARNRKVRLLRKRR